MAKFAVVRDGMKGPTQLAGAHIVCAHIAGRSRQSFRIAASYDDQVFIHNPGLVNAMDCFPGSRPNS